MTLRIFDLIIGPETAKQPGPSSEFRRAFLCSLLAALRSLATTRGTFLLGAKYVQQQTQTRISYLEQLSGLSALNKDAVTWRLLGLTGGTVAALLHSGSTVLKVVVLTCIVGAAGGYLLVDFVVKLYASYAKRQLLASSELAIRQHWDTTARPAFRATLQWFAKRYLEIAEQSHPTNLDELIDHRLSLLPSSELGADIIGRV